MHSIHSQLPFANLRSEPSYELACVKGLVNIVIDAKIE